MYGHNFPDCSREWCLEPATTLAIDEVTVVCARHAITELKDEMIGHQR